MTETKCVHIIASGLVQGVGFRYYVKQQADVLNLYGWVRNRYDDTVEILAQGDALHLTDLVSRVRTGPSRAQVTNLDVEWSEPSVKFTKFSIAPTD